MSETSVGGPGRVGPYRLISALGSGGMATVHRAVDERSGAEVALKCVRVADGASRLRLEREIHALARLAHPGIVSVVAAGARDPVPWYAMQLIEGQTLRAHLRAANEVTTTITTAASSDGALATRAPGPARPLPFTLAIVRPICDALAYLHGEGVVHRDLKPSNIVLRDGAVPVLVDFGLSAHAPTESRERLQLEREIVGTAGYMSPEQARGELTDARTDLYALGCILYELVTGERPFTAFTIRGLLAAHGHEPAPRPSARAAGVPPALDDLIVRLLAKDPWDRPGYADEVSGVLDSIGAGLPGVVVPRPAIPPRARPYLCRPRLIGRAPVVRRLLEHAGGMVSGGGVVVVGGESGTGKTRLALELVRSLEQAGRCVLLGELAEGAVRPLEALRGPLAAVGHEGGVRALLASAAGGDGGPRDELLDEHAAQHLFEALIDRFARAHGAAGTVLVLDDLQWADDLTVAFVEHVAARRPPGLAIIGLYRSEEAARVAHLPGLAGVRAFAIDRLADGDVATMIADLLATAAPPPLLVETVVARAEGNPFVVAEYLWDGMREGWLARERGAWTVPEGERSRVALALPAGPRALLRRRFASLGPAARLAVAVAAAIGRELDPALLGDVLALPPAALLDVTAELVARHVLTDATGGALRFAHDQLREAAYAELDPAERRRLHQQIASALEARGDDVYAIARHYALGDRRADPRRVLATSLAAARRSLDEAAPGEAERHLAVAAEVVAEAGLAVGAPYHAAWGEVHVWHDRLGEAAEALQRAIELEHDPVARARSRARLAFVHLTYFDAARAARECERVFAELGDPPGARGWLARVRGLVAGDDATDATAVRPVASSSRERLRILASAYRVAQIAAYYDVRAADFVSLALRAYFPARALGRSREQVHAFSTLALGAASAGRIAWSERMIARCVAVADELRDPQAQAIACVSRALATSLAGRSAEAAAQMQDAIDRHERWLSGLDHINATGALTWDLMMRGHTRAAARTHERQLDRLRRAHGHERSLAGHAARSHQLIILPMLGRADEAHDYLVEGQRLVDEHPENAAHRNAFYTHRVMYHVELRQLGPELERVIASCIQTTPRLFPVYHQRAFHVFHAYARLEQARRAPACALPAALAALARAAAALRRCGEPVVFRTHCLAVEAALARLRGADATARLDRADAAARAGDNLWARYEIAVERARLAADQGRRAAVHAALDAAAQLAEPAGWRPRLAELARLRDVLA